MSENSFEGAARKVGGHVESAVGDAVGSASTQAQGMADQVAGAAQSAAGAAQNAYGQAQDAVRRTADQVSDYSSQILDQIEEAGDMLAEQIDQRPITAVLIAAGIGFLLALATKPPPQVIYRRR